MPRVYDKEKEQLGIPGKHDDLGVSEENRATERASLEDDFNAPSYDANTLQNKERSPASNSSAVNDGSSSDQLGSGYKQEKEKKNLRGRFANKKTLIGGGVIGGGILGLLGIGMLIMPLKVLHIANNLQERYFAASEDAADNMTDSLMRAYIVRKVMPGMIAGRCSSTLVNKECVATTSGDGPVAILYNAWRDNKFEQKLAEKGIVIERRGSNNFKLVTPSTLKSGGIDLGAFDDRNPNTMDQSFKQAMSRGEVRREVRKAFEAETFSKRIFYRYKVGKLLERKYGIARCTIACNTKDRFRDSVEAKKSAWKMAFARRVITPVNEAYGLAIQCALSDFNCTQTPEADPEGMQQSELEKELKASVNKYSLEGVESGNLSDEEREKRLITLQEEVDNVNSKGIFTVGLEKVIGEQSAKFATKAIPIVGWIDLGAQLNKAAREAGPSLKKINYAINASTFLTTYMMYRSNADEIKTGEVDAQMVGSVADSLGPTNGTDQNGLGAETTPMYREIMGGSSATAASLLPQVSAESKYQCNNEAETISNGVCSEMKLNQTGALTDTVNFGSAYANSPIMKSSNLTADFWNATAGKVLDAAGSLLGSAAETALKVVGLGGVIEKATEYISAIAQWFLGYFINNPIGESPSGGRMFDMAAGGASLAGNDVAHYGLGGQRISNAALAQIREQQEQDDRANFASQNMFAKIFDTSSKHSLISRTAIAMPSNPGTMLSSLFGGISNPFGSIKFSSATNSVGAADGSNVDEFGITNYGYGGSNPVFDADPESYWKSNCSSSDTAKNWGDKSVTNPDTQMPEHDITNGCKLMETAVGMSCGIYDDQCIPAEDRGVDPASIGNGVSVMTWNLCRKDADCGNLSGAPSDNERAELNTRQFGQTLPDIAGLQEADEIADKLKSSGAVKSNYDIFESGTRSILWKKSLFSKTADGTFDMSEGRDNMPWVKLKSSATGKEIFAVNIHTQVASGSARTIDANKTVDLIKSKMKDAPVFIIGDMNSQYPGHNSGNKGSEVYDVFKKAGYTLTFTAASKKINDDCQTSHSFEVQCNDPNGSHIDAVYLANADGALVNSWELIKNETTQKASDHRPVIVNVNIPGLTASDGDSGLSTVGGFTFPLKTSKSVIKNNKPAWCWNKTTNCHHSAPAADIFAPTGTVVVSATPGTVVSAKDSSKYPSAVASRVAIKADDGKLYYYAHMGRNTIKVKNGDKVNGGSEIGKVGTNADAMGTPAHLHIDVLPSQYNFRPSCTYAACASFPFIEVQSGLSKSFEGLP